MSNTIWVLQREQNGVGYESCTHIETETFWFNKPSVEQLVGAGFAREVALKLHNTLCHEVKYFRWNLLQVTEGEKIL